MGCRANTDSACVDGNVVVIVVVIVVIVVIGSGSVIDRQRGVRIGMLHEVNVFTNIGIGKGGIICVHG